jgi:hypothetical protein
MRFTSRLAALIVGAVVSLTALVGVAQAQVVPVPGMPFPPYNPNGQYCYVARPVQGGVNCGNLNAQLSNAVRGLLINGHQVQAYVMFVREPEGGIPQVQGTPPAGVVADFVLSDYKTKGVNAGFPAQDFIMLVLTQKKDGSGWYHAERWGADINPYFSFPEMRNILDGNVQTLHSGDLQGYAAAVISQTVTAVGTAVNAANRPLQQPTYQTRPRQQAPVVVVRHEPSEPFPWGTVFMWLIGIAVVAGIVVFVVRRVSAGNAAKEAYTQATKKTKPITDNVATQVDTLMNSYDGLAQGTKKYTPGTKDEALYKAALVVAGDYFSHAEALKAYQAKIDAAVAKGDYVTANALVEGSIEITGDEIPAERRTATSGKSKKESIPYAKLVSTIGAEFESANQTFANLSSSLQKTMNNKKVIDEDLKKIDANKTAVVAAGISFAPFQAEYDAISTGVAAFVKKVFGAPITAFEESETLKTRVAALSTALATVMELKKTQVSVATKVEEARTKVTDTRAKTCEFEYTGTASATFTLKGVGVDEALAEADAQVKALGVALEGGKVEDASKAKEAALAAAAKASNTVDAVLKAKASVEVDAPALWVQFGNDAPAIASIKALYGAQDFVTANYAVESLKELGKLVTVRDNTKRAVGQAANWVSDNTRNLLASACRSVDNVSTQTTGANVNWEAVAKAANAAEAEFTKVNDSLVADGKVLDGFKHEVATLRQEFDAAQVDAGNPDADQGPNGAKAMLGPVASKLATLEGFTAAATKQNWADLTSQTNSTRGTVQKAHNAAKAQIAEAAQYDAQIREVEDKYGTMEAADYGIRNPRARKTYRPGVSINSAPQYSAYQAHLDAAETYRRQRQWDRMEQELAYSRAQLDMMNTWMWWNTWNMMTISRDPWAQQYAYDQGFRDGQSYDTYHTHVTSTPGYDPDAGYEPTPVSQWTPSQPISNCSSSSKESRCSGGDSDNMPQSSKESRCSSDDSDNTQPSYTQPSYTQSSNNSQCSGGSNASCSNDN